MIAMIKEVGDFWDTPGELPALPGPSSAPPAPRSPLALTRPSPKIAWQGFFFRCFWGEWNHGVGGVLVKVGGVITVMVHSTGEEFWKTLLVLNLNFWVPNGCCWDPQIQTWQPVKCWMFPVQIEWYVNGIVLFVCLFVCLFWFGLVLFGFVCLFVLVWFGLVLFVCLFLCLFFFF